MNIFRRRRTRLRVDCLPPWSTRDIAAADLVVFNGKTWKNRWGVAGQAIGLPDGCYRLTDLSQAVAA